MPVIDCQNVNVSLWLKMLFAVKSQQSAAYLSINKEEIPRYNALLLGVVICAGSTLFQYHKFFIILFLSATFKSLLDEQDMYSLKYFLTS